MPTHTQHHLMIFNDSLCKRERDRERDRERQKQRQRDRDRERERERERKGTKRVVRKRRGGKKGREGK